MLYIERRLGEKLDIVLSIYSPDLFPIGSYV